MSGGANVVVLGCGMGGLTASRVLSKQVGNAATVTIIEQRTSFRFPPAFQWLVFGWRNAKEVQRNLSTLARGKNLRLINEKAESIDVAKRRVKTRTQEVGYDRLIIALGAELSFESIQGLENYSYHAYDLEGSLKLREAVENFEGGRVAIGISRIPIKCPAAPYELALLLEDHLRRAKKRAEIQFFTPETLPVPAAGAVIGKQVERLLASRGIEYHPKTRLVRVEEKKAVFEGGLEIPYDLLITAPPHVCPRLVVDAGLTDSSGWIPVNPNTLATKHEDVYAIGDVAAVETPHGHADFLPKAGVFAQGQAEVVANNIAVSITGKGQKRQWDGSGSCFLDVNRSESAFLRGTFLSNPPRLEFHPPRRKWHLERVKLEKQWMGK
jgi:sulfide:quinone oxidoreductase